MSETESLSLKQNVWLFQQNLGLKVFLFFLFNDTLEIKLDFLLRTKYYRTVAKVSCFKQNKCHVIKSDEGF